MAMPLGFKDNGIGGGGNYPRMRVKMSPFTIVADVDVI